MDRKDELLTHEVILFSEVNPIEEIFLGRHGYKKVELPNEPSLLIRVESRQGDYYVTPSGGYYKHNLQI